MKTECSNNMGQRFADGANSRNDKSMWLVDGGPGRDGEEAALVPENSQRQQDVTSAQGRSLRGPKDTASCVRTLLCAQDGAGGKSPHLSYQKTLTMAIPPRVSVASFDLIMHQPFHFLTAAG